MAPPAAPASDTTGAAATPLGSPATEEAVNATGAAAIDAPRTACGADGSSSSCRTMPATGATAGDSRPGRRAFSPLAVATMMPPHSNATMQNTRNGAR